MNATILGATNRLVVASALAAPVSADDQAVEAADRVFEEAVARDPFALEMQTDPAFSWIDSTGTLQSRQEILDAFGAGTAPQLLVVTTAVGVQLTTRVYGQLAFVQVHAGRSYRFASLPNILTAGAESTLLNLPSRRTWRHQLQRRALRCPAKKV